LTKPFDSAELIQTVKKHLIGWQQRMPPQYESMRTRLRRRG